MTESVIICKENSASVRYVKDVSHTIQKENRDSPELKPYFIQQKTRIGSPVKPSGAWDETKS